MELKKQIKGELLKQKEEKQKKLIKENSKLKVIDLYVKSDHALSDNFKKVYKESGIKFKEFDIEKHKEINSITQNNQFPVIFINGNYLVQGRDFQSPQQSMGAIRHFADPEYVNPSFENKVIEQLKNMNTSINRGLQMLSRQLQPVVKIMNELAAEEKAEQTKKENAKKNK
tara:strand:+ start:521 stop:1033 length:513 start_codon:yes stop_codon:yes gene_type:complete